MGRRERLKRAIRAFMPNQSVQPPTPAAEVVHRHQVLGAHEPCLCMDQAREALMLPMLEGDGPDRQRGGVLVDQREHLASRQLRARREQPTTAAPLHEWHCSTRPPAKALAGTWLLGGFLHEHFGHFLSESLPRLWPLLESNRSGIDGILFIGHDGGVSTLSASQQELITHVHGNAKVPVRICTTPLRVEQLLMANQASTLGPLSEPTDAYLALLKQHQPQRTGSSVGARLYVSRSRIASSSRLIGERLIEAVLLQAGFQIFHPQENPIDEQLRTYLAADTLVCCEGSAIHGIELLGQLEADCVVISRGGLRSRRLRAMQSVLRKRCQSLTLFSAIRRHPAMETMTNALGQDVPAHWNSGVWISYPALVDLLRHLAINPELMPSRADYQQAMKLEMMDYLLDLNTSHLSQAPARTTRAMQVLLSKFKADLTP